MTQIKTESGKDHSGNKIDINIKAGVFGIIRSSSGKPVKRVFRDIKRQYPELTNEDIGQIVSEFQ